MTIPADTIEQVRSRTSIAEIIGDVVALKRSGRNLSGLCPFHAEKTASFFVNDEEGFFHCFGCGKKGSVYDFVMETKGLTFPEAVRFLAGRAGITIHDEGGPADGVARALADKRKKLRLVVAEAVQVYHEILLHERLAQPGRQYFASRHISSSTIEKFRLGYAPPERDLIFDKVKERIKGGLFEEDKELQGALREVGLIGVRADGTCYDSFRGRVIFPISRSDGAPVAFGGRIIVKAPNKPKYINSCESPLYSKRKVFFGLNSALQEMRKGRMAYIVEGYMDVLSMVQAGYENTLATCGTALTPDHVQILKRFADRVSVVFDGDAAGVKAAASCFEVFLNSAVDVSAVILPEVEDPSSLVEKGGREALAPYVEKSGVPVVDVYLRRLQELEGDTPAAKGRIAKQVARTLTKVQNAVERESLIERVLQQLGTSREAFDELLQGEKPREVQRKPAPAPAPVKKTFEPAPAAPSQLDRYFSQLVISVLCEPGLAPSILDMPSLMQGPSRLVESFPEEVKSFLAEMANTSLTGVATLRSLFGEPSNAEFQTGLSQLAQVLDRYGLGGHGLLEEALRQASIGGAQPRKVVMDASRVTATENLVEQVERLRSEEAKVSDEENRKRLIQEKLLKRRSLKQLAEPKR